MKLKLFAAVVAAGIYLWVINTVPIATGQAVKLDRYYGLIAIGFLYLTLLATPLKRVFNNFPFKEPYLKSRKDLGILAFFFSILHSSFAFFGELGGFPGLGFLDNKYLLGMSLSLIALIILFLMTISSIDFIFNKTGISKAKFMIVHKFVYLAGVLLVIHVLILGSDFSDLSGLIPQIFFVLLLILLGLESVRIDQYLKYKFKTLPNFGLTLMIFLLLAGGLTAIIYGPNKSSTNSPFNVHAAHIQLAKDAQTGSNGLNYSAAVVNNSALIGDRTKRFTVSFDHPDQILPNTDTNLSFKVYDASSGNPVNLFQFVYTKTMHLIIVDSELNSFNHIHPTQTNDAFNITTQFPKAGVYHLYIDFQPLGAIEQSFGFSVNVGNVDKPVLSTEKPDTNLTKTFGNYEVSLAYPTPLKASDLSIGNQKLTFTIKDAKTNNPITTLKPYLASFGHLVMVNESTFDYIHVHPTNLVAPAPNSNGGPNVEFLPLGLYGPIKPGIYRVFAQFNPDNNLFTSNFTVEVK